jgi:hypothetical protein
MKKPQGDEMRKEYKLQGGTKNPFAKRYAKGTNLVLIEPDIFKVFPSSEEVNAALRLLAKVGTRVGAQTTKLRVPPREKAS